MRRVLLGVVVLLAALPVTGAQAAETSILVSNFRFCIERPFPCDPLDVGYVPDPGTGAPLVPVYSPITTATVEPGDTVTWKYADDFCDAIAGCQRHEIWLTDGIKLAELPARSGPQSFSWTVPATYQPGAVIPYFCKYNNHFVSGMTGALEIAGGY